MNSLQGKTAVDASKILYVDAHCHLEDPEFDEDRDEVIQEAKNSGIICITCGLGLKKGKISLDISRKHKGQVFACVGMPPYSYNENNFSEVIEFLRKNSAELVGIGEVGLDFYWVKEKNKREEQKEHLKKFIQLAKELDKPLIIHSRSAGKYAIEILIEEEANHVLMHAFDGKWRYAQEGVKYGYYFSIPTSVVRSKQKQKLARMLPLENLMVETDSPVLSPVQGERNKPSNLPYAIKKIAELKRNNFEEIAKITTENARKFFSLSF